MLRCALSVLFLLANFTPFHTPTALAQTASATHKVRIALPGNKSEVDGVLSNPLMNWQRKAADLALASFQPQLQAKKIEVEFVEYDYGSSKVKTLETAQAIAKSDALAVVGYGNSADALLAGKILQEARIPFIAPTATADRLEEVGRYVRRICFDDSFQGRIMADYAWQDQKIRRIGIISVSDCAYCQSLRAAFRSKFESNGGEVVADELILSTDTDFSQLVTNIKTKGQIDAIFLPTYEGTAARLIPQMIDAGASPKVWLAGDGWGITLELFHRIMGRRTYTAYSISHWGPKSSTDDPTRFLESFESKYKVAPNDTAVLTYDAVRLLLAAILKADTLTREKVLEAVEGISTFEGVSGKITYATGKRTPSKPAVIVKLQDQKVETVKTVTERRL